MEIEDNYTLKAFRQRRSASGEQLIDWRKHSILVVEDTPSNINLIQKYLCKTGARLLLAENGMDAVRLVETNPAIDLVLMDIKLPEFNGLQATLAIKKTKPLLPVIAQTAFAMESDRELCLEAGCDAFLAKPYRKHELIELVQAFL